MRAGHEHEYEREGGAGRFVVVLALSMWIAGCSEERPRPAASAPTYTEIGPVLQRACSECHSEPRTEAGYSVQSYATTLGCLDDGRVAVEPASAEAPLVAVLERDDHAGYLTSVERDEVLAWVSAEVPSERSVMHAPGILNPRGAGWHGALAANDGYAALRDASAELACGRCHAGAPVAPEGSTGATDGATACTQCHTQAAGVLACNTCHGSAMHAYPPRDSCYFGGPDVDPHARHAEPGVRTEGFDCASCHPVPNADDLFAAQHTNGTVDVVFEGSPLVGDDPEYDAGEQRCAVGCHNHAGESSEPRWTVDAALDCQSCHLSPPADHYPGTCDTCHQNMGAGADSLKLDARHMNGVVDVGDSQGTCGSCHGSDESGAPDDVGHPQHLDTVITTAIGCDTCHAVPTLDDLQGVPTHLNGRVDVQLSGRAIGPGDAPSYDATSTRCTNIACHGAARVEPLWGHRSSASADCAACHVTPPPPPHSALPGCGGGLCHGNEVAPLSPGYRITESGRAVHIDGVVQAGEP